MSEGSKSEPNYFGEIKAVFRLHTANVEVRFCETGTAPIQVVQYALDLFEHGDRHKRIQPRAFEQVYAVFDRDDHDSYTKALRLAESLDSKQKKTMRSRSSVSGPLRRFPVLSCGCCFTLRTFRRHCIGMT